MTSRLILVLIVLSSLGKRMSCLFHSLHRRVNDSNTYQYSCFRVWFSFMLWHKVIFMYQQVWFQLYGTSKFVICIYKVSYGRFGTLIESRNRSRKAHQLMLTRGVKMTQWWKPSLTKGTGVIMHYTQTDLLGKSLSDSQSMSFRFNERSCFKKIHGEW